jgi:hypothetical protein
MQQPVLPRVLQRISDEIESEFGDKCETKVEFKQPGGLPTLEFIPHNPRAAGVWISGWDEGITMVIPDFYVDEPPLADEDAAVRWAVDETRKIARHGVVQTRERSFGRLFSARRTDALDGERMAEILGSSKEEIVASREPW